MQKYFEKIIERLKEQKEKSAYITDGIANRRIYDNGIKNAIEIVNNVAEEYNNEFCEWKKVVIDSTELIREPHRMYLFKTSDDEWVYCPYCGKEIKVVE